MAEEPPPPPPLWGAPAPEFAPPAMPPFAYGAYSGGAMGGLEDAAAFFSSGPPQDPAPPASAAPLPLHSEGAPAAPGVVAGGGAEGTDQPGTAATEGVEQFQPPAAFGKIADAGGYEDFL